MQLKIHSNAIKKYAIILFFIGIIFIIIYNNYSGYKEKKINELSLDDLGKKISICGKIESIKKQNNIFLKITSFNSSVDVVFFKKDITLINIELSKYNMSLFDLKKKNYICVEGRYEKYNSKFEIIAKRISQIEI